MKPKHVCIGLAVHRSSRFDRDILRGVVRYASNRPEWTFTSIIAESELRLKPRTPRIAGLIASVISDVMSEALARARIPVVDVGAVLPQQPFAGVRADNRQVAELAAVHFIERGLRHFAYVGEADYLYSMERHAEFLRALRQRGHAAETYLVAEQKPFDPLIERWDLDRGVQPFLRNLPKPVGIFVPGDHLGVQLTEACRQLGLRVPEDVAVLGVDDDDLDCEMSRPRLSSIILPSERMGFEAAGLLDRLLAGEKPRRRTILLPPSGIATRRSTDVLAIDDQDVVRAVKYIREHPHQQLRVADILREVAIGQRTLERRFIAALGHSLQDEIRRVHVERACQLLAQTELPIKTVAHRSGFSGLRHLGHVFRQTFNISPTVYRHQNGIARSDKVSSN